MRLGITNEETAPPPAWIKPQLAKLVEKAPDGPDWLHEIKFDGYRMHARLDAGRVQNLTCMGLSLSRGLFPRAGQLIGDCCLLFGYADSSLFGAGKAVLRPVACDQVPGAREGVKGPKR